MGHSISSDHLKEVVLKLHTYGILSLFMDADASKYDGLQDVSGRCRNLYRPYAEDFAHEGRSARQA